MSTKPKFTNNDYTQFIDPDPQPEPVPPKGRGISPGRAKHAKYVALTNRCKEQPGVDLLIATLPAHTKTPTARARQIATGLRSTLIRYDVKVTERKLEDTYKVWARYDNGTTP